MQSLPSIMGRRRELVMSVAMEEVLIECPGPAEDMHTMRSTYAHPITLGCALATALLVAPILGWGIAHGSTPVWGRLGVPVLPGPVAAYDARRDRVIVFSGSPFGLWAIPAGQPAHWSGFVATGPAPPTCAAMFADSLRDRMVVWDGSKDLYVLDLAAPRWTRVIATGGPGFRAGAALAYDATNEQIFMFGGSLRLSPNYTQFYNDVYAITVGDSSMWTAIVPSGPSPSERSGLTGFFDAARQRMIVLGGVTNLSDAAWALSLSATPQWTRLNVSLPAPSMYERMVPSWDRAGNRLIVFGASTEPQRVWQLPLDSPSNADWSEVATAGGPVDTLFGAATFVDPVRRTLWAVGGSAGTPGITQAPSNRVWTLPLVGPSLWTLENPFSNPPLARLSPSVFDPAGRRLIVLPGMDSNGKIARSDAWSLSFAGDPDWTPLVSAGPTVKEYAAAIFDGLHDRAITFGGDSARVYALDLSSGPPTWSELSTSGVGPGALRYSAAVWDSVRDRMLILGGFAVVGDSLVINEDVWALSIGSSPAWTMLSTSGPKPAGRFRSTATIDATRDQLLLYSGVDTVLVFRDVWSLDLATLQWTEISASAPPQFAPATAIDSARDRLVLIGGDALPPFPFQFYALSLGALSFSPILPLFRAPSFSWQRAATADAPADRMLIADPGQRSVFSLEFDASAVPRLEILTAGLKPEGYPFVTWRSPDLSIVRGIVQASADGGAWTALDTVPADATGVIGFTHIAAAAGRSYRYRLNVPYDDTSDALGETPAVVAYSNIPPPVTFSIRPVQNPSPASLAIRYSVPYDVDVRGRIELYDISGRRLRWRELGNGVNAGGFTTLELGAGLNLKAGIYFIRLTQRPDFAVTSRVVVIE